MSIFRKETPVEKAIKTIESLTEQEQAELLSRLDGFGTPKEATPNTQTTEPKVEPQPTQPQQVQPTQTQPIEQPKPVEQPKAVEEPKQAQPIETPNQQVQTQQPSQSAEIDALMKRIEALEQSQNRVPTPAKPDDVEKLNRLAAIYT